MYSVYADNQKLDIKFQLNIYKLNYKITKRRHVHDFKKESKLYGDKLYNDKRI